LWEVALVLLIIGLVAGWRFTPPPRALSQVPVAIAAEPIMAHLIDGDVMAMVTVAPGKAGPVAMDIMISDLEHVPRAVQDVTLIVSNGALGIEPIHRTAVDLGGVWRVEDLTLPVAGTWQVEIEVRVSTFERAAPRRRNSSALKGKAKESMLPPIRPSIGGGRSPTTYRAGVALGQFRWNHDGRPGRDLIAA
jgi:hypothetical protein